MDMTPNEAWELGFQRGTEAVDLCEVGEDETLREAAFRAEMNARQFHGHIPSEIHRDNELFDHYEDGVASAINQNT